MNWKFLIIGLLGLIAGILFLRYFTKPSYTKRNEYEARDADLSEDVIEAMKMRSKMVDIKGWICGIGLIFFGLLCIYAFLKNN